MVGMRVVKMSKNRYSSHLLLVHVCYYFHQVSAVWPVKVTSSMTGCQEAQHNNKTNIFMNYKVDSTVQSTLFVFFKHLVITVKRFTRI